jgi:hypothetical protein
VLFSLVALAFARFALFFLRHTNINTLSAQTTHASLDTMSGKRSSGAENESPDRKRLKVEEKEEDNFPYG